MTSQVTSFVGSDFDVCQGGSVSLDGSNSQGSQFLWAVTSGDFTSIDIGGTSNTAIVSPLFTTNYTLTVTDPVNGCVSVEQITVFVDVSLNPTAVAEIEGGQPGCSDTEITLIGEK